ncbi:nitrogen regulation protein NR(I) [Pseudogulbenkiania subflava]|uniref:DNA-binding transcriptional regulator NtrC n=1 Tax=Pseudogulbenkiania subflava DSM 22618 TaxID=1123014 RepID=A0A1Y6BF91_9NEIS|nr:nitrogen regulation protein NR(I) [Pseudogulbenkiania subflava]SME98355.1 two-component system, NtrC family, nitrogen regulation response regulator GlnG [Pseudogulbenkiania subflava DSM 22618]
MHTNPVWIIDDDKAIRWVLEKALARGGIGFESFASADDALNALYDASPRVIISDIRMPGTDGLKFLSRVKLEHPEIPVIIMTAHSDLDSAVAAFQGGAFEYLPKPFDVDQATALIERALAETREPSEAQNGEEEMPALLGQAPAMQDVFRAIGRLSQSSVTVLITGESGTGKERVAEALHRHSVRASKPFIALNTAAIPKDLLESELFGHEKGAFTGALASRRGRFEEAEGGTLFLDEIGDMPIELQTRLLRVLSDGHFYRVGGHTPIKANVRVIAATHQNLEERVKNGQFREDLFHRLNVIRLRLPPMRERSEDIPILTRYFLLRSAKNLGVEPKRLSDAAMELVRHYPFPGNVRQLENLCQWITVMAPGQTVELSDLPTDIRDPALHPVLEASGEGAAGPAAVFGGDWMKGLADEVARRLRAGEIGIIDDLTRRFEETCIRSGLAHTGGRKVEAAHLLGWGRNTLTRKIQELGMEAAHGEEMNHG